MDLEGWLLISHHPVVNFPPPDGEASPLFCLPHVGVTDLKGLTALHEVDGRRLHRAVVLYTGRETLPFDSDHWALPVSALWQLGARPVRKRQ